MFWIDWRKVVTPGTVASLGRSRRMIWSAVAERWSKGLSWMNMRPVLMPELPPPPIEEPKAATSGSCAMIFATASCRLAMPSKETS